MADSERRRPDPERLLKQIEAEERNDSRGHLKIFLGYASGVGKSLRMFDEGRRRKLRGQDVVVAATQTSMSPDVQKILEGMEVIPPLMVNGVPAIDVLTLLRRHPQVCLIDGLAYRNPPGSKNPHRWQDVEELRTAGIEVISSINIQYIAERQLEIEAIRGKSVSDSVPEAFIQTADEIEVVDATPEYCASRSIEGDEQRQLSELREIALVLAADVVDHQLEEFLHHQGGAQLYAAHERILVCVTPRSSAREMIRRARRQADRFHGDLYVVYVQQDNLKEADEGLLRDNLDVAHEAKAQVKLLTGEDAVQAILDFASQHGITQIFVGHSNQTGWASRLRSNPVERLIMGADGIDVRIFPHETVNA
jgi:two-component system, OmpR family, sensor histidine kinase KdpD